jgi:hypothetical protein
MDVVTEYEVINKEDKVGNDKNARKNFLHRANESLGFITEELKIIEPTTIFCLGSETYLFMNKHFSSEYQVKQITHPAAWGGLEKAKEQLKIELLVFMPVPVFLKKIVPT